MDVSAVVLSAKPVQLLLPGVEVVGHVSRFDDPAGLLDARIASLEKIKTEWFFFLDDDDHLPDDYLRVLDLCIRAGTPLAYTNELIVDQNRQYVRRSGHYSQSAHLMNRTYVHHLAVCRTAAALDAAKFIPRGNYGVEPLLYFQIAKQGATWIDEIGYVWCASGNGLSMHSDMLTAMTSSTIWAGRNL